MASNRVPCFNLNLSNFVNDKIKKAVNPYISSAAGKINAETIFGSSSGQFGAPGSALSTLVNKKLDDINPHVAAKMAPVFGNWRKFDSERQEMMKNALRDIAAKPAISRNLYEIVSKTLGEDSKLEKEKAVEIKQQEAKAKIREIKQKKACPACLPKIIADKARS